MKIAGHDLDRRTLMIAEIGVNHEGDFAVARRLLQDAVATGADAVKFQAYYPAELRFISPQADLERFQRTQRFVLTWDQLRTLAGEARAAGVVFLCTYFDIETVEALGDLVPAFKVASGDLTNVPLLRAVGRAAKPVILSTGMGTDEEIELALKTLRAAGCEPLDELVVLLHCISSYPCPPEQAQLRAIPHLRRRFGLRIGYSDHTIGIQAAQAAVALGACVIEKHFTDNKAGRTFRDHALSADAADLRELIDRIRAIETLLGREAKTVQPAEADNRAIMRRSIGVRRAVPAGTTLTSDILIALRPATGWPAAEVDAVIGRVLARSLEAGQLVSREDLVP